MQHLNDKEWREVVSLIDARMTNALKYKRDSNACACTGWHKPPNPNPETANFYAGVASACHDIITMNSSMICDLEELLHPIYDDEQGDDDA